MAKIGTRKEYHDLIGYGIMGKEQCVFCNYNDVENLFWKGNFWCIVHNIYPYSGNEKHVMAVPNRHITYSTELNNDELLELNLVHKKIKEFFGEENYFSCTRESIANRSIEHLHIHFVPGKLQGKFLRKMLELQGYPIKENLDIYTNIHEYN